MIIPDSTLSSENSELGYHYLLVIGLVDTIIAKDSLQLYLDLIDLESTKKMSPKDNPSK